MKNLIWYYSPLSIQKIHGFKSWEGFRNVNGHRGQKGNTLVTSFLMGENWQVFVASEISHFVQTQVDKIGNVSVRLEETKYTELIVPKDGWSEERETVSSLRLDTVISAVYNISRQRSKQLIESGKVKVNWTETLRPDFMLDLLDIVSIRGFGRIQIQGLEGTTKKKS